MNEMIIQGTSIQIKEYRGQRVVTFKDIDTIHKRPEGTARKRFADNRQRFVSGVDFFKISKEEIQMSEIRTVEKYSNNGVTLITESGYLMLVKSFTDDLAWKVQRELVNSYFRAREESTESQDMEISVIRPETFLEAARIMASVPNSQRYVINCLRHVVPDIDSEQTITVEVENKTLEIPVVDDTVTQVSIADRGCYKKPFNANQLSNYLIEHDISHKWLERNIQCSEGCVSRWCNGLVKPTIEYRIKICMALGLPEGYFDNTKRTRRYPKVY